MPMPTPIRNNERVNDMNKTMNHKLQFSLLLLGAALAAPVLAAEEQLPKFPRETTVFKIESGAWKGARLDDGQPDVQGFYSNTIANHSNLTDPQGGPPGGDRGSSKYKDQPREARAPSRIVDPADGQVPFQPWARAKQQEFYNNFSKPVKPEYIDPGARCAPAGPSRSFTWHGYEIAQYPGYVVIYFDASTRIIHLDNKPHLAANIKLWNGDSRGHWEGNTLVVDVSNYNGKARFARTGEFASENATVKERFIFDANKERFIYEATYTDPTVYTRPWTLVIPNRNVAKYREDGWNNMLGHAKHAGKEDILENYERICAENNGGFGGSAAPTAAAATAPAPAL
jgi:hypothetical protein